MFSRLELAEIIGKRSLRGGSNTLAEEIAAFLLDTGTSASLETVLRDVMEYRVSRGIIEATVVSAHTLDSDTLDEVRNILRAEYPKAREISLTSQIDPEVVGGIKVMLANEQLDLTLRSKMDNFKRLTAEIKD